MVAARQTAVAEFDLRQNGPRPDITLHWQFVVGAGVYQPAKHRTTYEGTGQVVPLGPDGTTREILFEYDSAARLKTISAPLSGALPLDRWHETDLAIAPEPNFPVRERRFRESSLLVPGMSQNGTSETLQLGQVQEAKRTLAEAYGSPRT